MAEQTTRDAAGWPRILSGSALWSAIDASASPLSTLILAAGLVRTLGASEYGLIVIALAVSALSTSMSPAIAATTTRFVSEVSSSSSTQGHVSRIITGSLIIVGTMGLVLFSVATVFDGPLSRWIFGGVIAVRPDIIPIMLLAVASLCVQQFDGVLAATLKGLLHFKRQACVEIISRVILVVTVIGAARLTGSVVDSLAIYCAAFGVSCVLRFAAVRSSLKGGQLLSLPQAEDMKRLLSFSGWMWLNAIATMAYGTVDRIIVGRVSGTTIAAEFNIYMQIAQLVHFIPASLFAFTYPVFSRLSVGSGQLAQARFLYRRYLVRCLVVSGTIIITLLLCTRPLLRGLTAGALPLAHNWAFLTLIANFALLACSIMPYYVTLGLGSARSVSLVTSLSMVVSLALTITLTPRFGLEGAVFARLAYSIGILGLWLLVRRTFSSVNRELSTMASTS